VCVVACLISPACVVRSRCPIVVHARRLVEAVGRWVDVPEDGQVKKRIVQRVSDRGLVV
jgi:hypothetical protein